MTASALTGVKEAASTTNDEEVCAEANAQENAKAITHSNIANNFFIRIFYRIETQR